jgi:ferredoxin
MRNWYKNLSFKQKVIMSGTMIVMLAIVLLGIVQMPDKKKLDYSEFTIDKNLSQLASRLGVTGRSLAKELKLDIESNKKKPVSEMGVVQVKLNKAVKHLAGHKDTTLKYYIYLALVFGALIYLLYLGRPVKADIKQRKYWFPAAFYNVFLVASVIFCGFMLGKSPNPMEGAVKVFKTAVGLYPDPLVRSAAFIFFILLAIIGNKIICGWACPFGSLQELIYSLPILKKIKSKKLPFAVTNFVRTLFFIVMLVILFGIIGGKKGMVVYHYVNPFNLFNLDFDEVSISISIIVFLSVAVFVYRPFCQLICPFGFISWAFEKISFNRVKIDFKLCTNCKTCVKACPLEAAKGILEKKKFRADCFSCTRCLKVCPVDAIEYKSVLKK